MKLKKIILPYRSLFDIYLVFVFIEYMHVYFMSFLPEIQLKGFTSYVCEIREINHGLLNRWTSQYDWGNTTEWLERIVNILQISYFKDMVHFDIGNALGQN